MLSGRTVAASTTFTALTMAAGNSLQIRNSPISSVIRLLQAWVVSQAAGALRIRSPYMHDNVQGVRIGHLSANGRPLLPDHSPQLLQPQDNLTVELTGSGTAGDFDLASLLVYYEDLPGAQAQLISAEDVRSRMKN